MSVVHYISGDEITVRHQTFSEHLWHLSEQKSICSVEVSERHLVTVWLHCDYLCAFACVHIRRLDSLAEIRIFDGRSKVESGRTN